MNDDPNLKPLLDFSVRLDPAWVRLHSHALRLSLLERRTLAPVAGEPGPPGPIGPMPQHRWIDGTSLQFQQGPDGDSWGTAVDLQGPPGPRSPVHFLPSGGGAANPAPAFSYYPSGW